MPLSSVHRATVLGHRNAGRGFFRLVLKAPALAAAAAPGQFVMLRVSQNLDPLLARPFGIASVRGRQGIEIYYRIAGRGTTLLSTVKAGEDLTVVGPLGKPFPVPEKGTTPLLVAGGSGFPPILHFAARHGATAHLFVGSRNKECLPPAAVMRDLRSRVRKVHYATEDGSCGACGFVTDALTAWLAGPRKAARPVIYACGPHALLAAVSRLAAEQGILCYVSTEERMACGLGVCMGCSVPMKGGGYKRACKEGPVFDSREIEWSSKTSQPLTNGKRS